MITFLRPTSHAHHADVSSHTHVPDAWDSREAGDAGWETGDRPDGTSVTAWPVRLSRGAWHFDEGRGSCKSSRSIVGRSVVRAGTRCSQGGGAAAFPGQSRLLKRGIWTMRGRSDGESSPVCRPVRDAPSETVRDGPRRPVRDQWETSRRTLQLSPGGISSRGRI